MCMATAAEAAKAGEKFLSSRGGAELFRESLETVPWRILEVMIVVFTVLHCVEALTLMATVPVTTYMQWRTNITLC